MREVKYWKAFNEAICEEMRKDPSIIYMAEDARGAVGGPFAMAKGLEDEFGGNRVFDTPDSEAGFVGAAIGAALTGMRPIVDISFSDFMLVAIDQIVNHMAKIRYMTGENFTKMPIVIHTMSGGGMRAGTQHSQCLEAWYVNVPGLKLVAPSNGYDLKGIMKSAIRDDDPVIVWLHKAMLRTKVNLPDEEYLIPLGKADIKKEGSDVTVVGISKTTSGSTNALASRARYAAHRSSGWSLGSVAHIFVPIASQFDHRKVKLSAPGTLIVRILGQRLGLS